MYYYKTKYTDGTWDLIKSKTPITDSTEVCATCCQVERKSIFWYMWQKLKEKIIFRKR